MTWAASSTRGPSPTPVFFSYGRSPREAANIARVFNDAALELTAPAQSRLIPFCQVPLQDPDLACAELDRCLEAGHRGVEIGNHVGDRDLDDAGVVTFLRHCAEVGAGVRASMGYAILAPAGTVDGAVADGHAC